MSADELDPFERPSAPLWWYFGDPWGGAVCSIYEHGATPVGSLCIHCSEPIAEGDRGTMMPFVADGGDVWPVPQHLECAICEVIRERPCKRRHQ